MSEETKMILEKLNLIGQDVSELKADVSGLKADVSSLKDRMTAAEGEIQKLHLLIENEISTKINVIAEGHLDLMRRLDEAQAVWNEREKMKLDILDLKIDMKHVKAVVGIA